MFRDDLAFGRRAQFSLRVLNPRGRYPNINFSALGARYVASKSLVYSVVPAEPPNEYGWSEVGWAELGEIRLWGALALSIREGRGFYTFVPGELHRSLYVKELRDDLIARVVGRVTEGAPKQEYDLHWVTPSEVEIGVLYDALLRANVVVLRGVGCFLKALLIFSSRESWTLLEEMGMNLYIALEAGLSVVRRRLSTQAGRSVSYADVFDFVRATFSPGDALAEYWEDAHDDRNALLHPDNDFSPYVIQPMSADDILDLLDPMLSLYRYILLDEQRPAFEHVTGYPET